MVAQSSTVVLQASGDGGSRGGDDCAKEWGCRDCEEATLVAWGAVMVTQGSDVGGSTSGGEGWLRNKEEGKWGRRKRKKKPMRKMKVGDFLFLKEKWSWNGGKKKENSGVGWGSGKGKCEEGGRFGRGKEEGWGSGKGNMRKVLEWKSEVE